MYTHHIHLLYTQHTIHMCIYTTCIFKCTGIHIYICTYTLLLMYIYILYTHFVNVTHPIVI